MWCFKTYASFTYADMFDEGSVSSILGSLQITAVVGSGRHFTVDGYFVNGSLTNFVGGETILIYVRIHGTDNFIDGTVALTAFSNAVALNDLSDENLANQDSTSWHASGGGLFTISGPKPEFNFTAAGDFPNPFTSQVSAFVGAPFLIAV